MTNMMMNGVVAINGGVGVMEIRQPLPQTVESVAQPVENLTVNAHISLRELKNTVAAVIEKKLPKYAQLMEMHPVIAARTVVGGATLTAYENGYAVYEEDGAHTVMAIDRCGDYCVASRPSIEGDTNEDSKEVKTDTLTLQATPLANGYVKAKTGTNTSDDVYNKWYEKVYEPQAEASGVVTEETDPQG